MKKMSSLLVTILYLGILLALTACFPTESGLVGTNWMLTSYGPISAPTPTLPGIETSLSFGADGKLSGRLGCNILGGDYKITGQNITFGPVLTTKIACNEAQMAQETAAFHVLQDTASFKLDGNILSIRSSDGNSILTFQAVADK
jgi:putative lipoprotein